MAVILNALQQSLSAEFGIPTDIKFLFKGKEANGSLKTEEIRAHKHILALASDVFKRGFYGGMEDDGIIEITDVTKEVFEVMINRIYDKEIIMKNYDLDMICSIYYLADKYNIAALEIETLEAIESKEIQVEDIIDVGVLALKHEVHDKLAEALLEASAQKLARISKGKLNKALDTLDYLSKIDGDESYDITKYKSMMKIMARMRDITVCSNCKVFPCISGVRLSRDNFVPGARIKHWVLDNNSSDSDTVDHSVKLYKGDKRKLFLGVCMKTEETERCFLKYFEFKC